MLSITFLGHATTLIDWDGSRFLTDPFLCNHLGFLRRLSPLPIDPSRLPDITAILISHAHFDHLNIGSFKYLSEKPLIVVPEGLGRFVANHCNNPVLELPFWGQHTLPDGTKLQAFPARHRGGRVTHLRYHRTNMYLLQRNGQSLFFAGDTGHTPLFQELGRSLAPDVAILPIGCNHPRFLTKMRHMNPPEALQAFRELNAKTMIPIHWGCFRLTLEPATAPVEWLKRLITADGLADRVRILQPGEQTTVS